MTEPVPRARVEQDFKRVVVELGHVPTQQEYKDHGEYSVTTVCTKFDPEGGTSYNRAVREIGYEPRSEGGSVETPREELCADFERVVELLGRVPMKSEYDEYGEYHSSTIARRLDSEERESYHHAVRTLGYNPPDDQQFQMPADVMIDQLDPIVDEVGLSESVQQTAQSLIQQWTQINDVNLSLVRSTAAAALAIACSVHNKPYSIKDIAEGLPEEVSASDVNRVKARMIRGLNEEIDIDLSPTHPEDYINRFVDEANLPDQVAITARNILTAARNGDSTIFSGRSPSGIAAAAVRMAAAENDEYVFQGDLEDISNTTGVTIRNSRDKLLEAIRGSGMDLDEVIPEIAETIRVSES